MKIEYLLLKEENKHCKNTDALLSLLKSNSEISIGKKEIDFKKFSVKYSITSNTVNNKAGNTTRYFLFEIERNDPSRHKLLDEFEKFSNLTKEIRESLIRSALGFEIVVLQDTVSAYYSELSYPMLNEIENLMRKLIYKFMFQKVGINWFHEATPKDVKEEIQKRAESNNVKNLRQESLQEADFISLSNFLFKPYPTKTHEEIVSKLRESKSIKELDYKELKELVPKSNWDRYFSKIVELETLQKKWTELYSLRIKIAHNKPVIKADYEKIKLLSSEIKNKLINAIEKIEEVKINQQDKQDVSEFTDIIFSPHYIIPAENYFSANVLDPTSEIIKSISNENFSWFNDYNTAPVMAQFGLFSLAKPAARNFHTGALVGEKIIEAESNSEDTENPSKE